MSSASVWYVYSKTRARGLQGLCAIVSRVSCSSMLQTHHSSNSAYAFYVARLWVVVVVAVAGDWLATHHKQMQEHYKLLQSRT